MAKPINEHEGKKYLRLIKSAVQGEGAVLVDVYAVIEAFQVTCPGRQQAIKKLLMTGQRGKGDTLADLIGADAALSRAIELQRERDAPIHYEWECIPNEGEYTPIGRIVGPLSIGGIYWAKLSKHRCKVELMSINKQNKRATMRVVSTGRVRLVPLDRIKERAKE